MSRQQDPNWGRSKPHSKSAEFVVLIVAIALMVWAMIDAVSYAREIGRPLGVGGFVALFFRESLMLSIAVLGAVGLVLAWIYRGIRRLFEKARSNEPAPTNDR